MGKSQLVSQLSQRIDELERREYNYRSLLNIIQALNSTLDFDRLLEIFVFTAFGHFSCSRAAIYLCDDNASWSLHYEKGFDALPDGDSSVVLDFFRCCQEARQPVCLSSLDPGMRNMLAAFDVQVLAPLLSRDKEVGILILGPKESGQAYDSGDLAFLKMLCDQLSILIYNSRQYAMATRDPMLKLYRRHMFSSHLDKTVAQYNESRRPFGLLMIDIDHFKSINDTYGHQVGDKILIEVAETISRNCRANDLPARYGGEEFCVILPGCRLYETEKVAERIRRDIEDQVFSFDGMDLRSTVSIGYTACESIKTKVSQSQLVKLVDQSLYHAKNTGRNRIHGLAPDAVQGIQDEGSVEKLHDGADDGLTTNAALSLPRSSPHSESEKITSVM